MRIWIHKKHKKQEPVEPKPIIYPNVKIGEYSYVKMFSVVFPNVEIGRYTCIANNCSIGAVNHDLGNLSIVRPAVGISDKPLISDINPIPTKIGNDVWIGCNVGVVAGCYIPDGCVVAAGAVVTTTTAPPPPIFGVGRGSGACCQVSV